MTMEIPLATDLTRLVLSGKKTSTVRLGIRNYPLGPARIVSGSLGIPIEITEIEFSKVGYLDASIARTEGYDSVTELMRALRTFYPGASTDRDVTIVRFRRL
jgi:hypothetical protein